jgi:hypothetical protein
MSNTDFFNTFCALRKQKMLTNIPTPPRVELQPSPYERGFTQEQLNMRRKYEILQYSANAQSTQTNNLTKKQQYSLSVRGYGQEQRYSVAALAQMENCPIPQVPTTHSNVPGPSILLYKDDNVPLYNYQTVTDQQTHSSFAYVSDYKFSENEDNV